MEDRESAKEPLESKLERMRQRIAELEAWKKQHESVAEELTQSEAKFRKLAEKSVVGIYLIQDGLLKYVNPKFEQIFGYDVDDISNKLEAKSVVYPDDRPIAEENIRKRISGEVEAVHFQFRGVKKNGEMIHVEAFGSRIDHLGRPAVIGTLVDITGRVRVRRDLEKQLNTFQALYELALAMAAHRTLDENLTVIVNKSRELLGTDTAFIALRDGNTDELCWHISSGLRTEDFKNLRVPMGSGLAGIVAQSGQWLIVEDYFDEVGPEFHDVTRAEGLISGIAVPVQIGKTNFGVLFAFNRTKQPFSTADLETLLLFGNLAAVEITRKLTLESLQESEENYRKLYQESKKREELYSSFLNSSADAIVIYGPDGKAQYVSPSFTRIFGWTMEEINGPQTTLVPETELESQKVLIEQVVGKGTAVTGFETQRKAKDGSTLDVSVSASRYHDHEGNAAGMSVILRDITAFKSLERARRRAAHHMSHELITPVALIEGSLRQLSKKGLTKSGKEKNIQRIQRNLERLKNVQEILREIVAPRQYEPRMMQVDTVIREILDELQKESAPRSVAVLPRIEPFKSDIIDPHVFEEVLTTLVKNAVENTPDEGKIYISVKPVPVGVLLEVEDTGVGITAGDREFIFKAFHHTQDTERYGTKKPFHFNAGGKGLELMRLKILSEGGIFDISFVSGRCRHIPTNRDECCGTISLCPHVASEEECKQSGGTTFSVLFIRP